MSSSIPFVPVKPIRGGRPMDSLFDRLMADPTWVCQAKLNGKRAIWDGEVLWTRTGNRVPVGQAQGVLSALSSIKATLDGEFAKNKATGLNVYYVFDLPDHSGPLHERWALLERLIRPGSSYLKLCPAGVKWADVEANGWEGVVFKKLNSKYEKAMTEGKLTPSWVKYRAEWL